MVEGPTYAVDAALRGIAAQLRTKAASTLSKGGGGGGEGVLLRQHHPQPLGHGRVASSPREAMRTAPAEGVAHQGGGSARMEGRVLYEGEGENMTVRMQVFKDQVGSIIGKGGANIMQIRQVGGAPVDPLGCLSGTEEVGGARAKPDGRLS